MNWEMIWQAVFLILLAAFAMMSVLVTICGAQDIRRLLTHLRAAEDASSEEQETGSNLNTTDQA